MKYLIDCGATRCKIAIVHKGHHIVELPGFNPQSGSWRDFQLQLELFFKKQGLVRGEVTFYGAGLSTSTSIEQMRALLLQVTGLDRDRVRVFADLYASAHAVYNDHPVLIGILGTGSNVGYYDGKELSRQTPSLGFLLADEGSGVDLGRRLLLDYHYGRLSGEIVDRLDQMPEASIEHVIAWNGNPRRLHAICSELSRLVGAYKEVKEVSDLCHAAFGAFVENRLRPEMIAEREVREVFLFGAIAVQFEDMITKVVASRLNIKTSSRLDPLDLLIQSEIDN